MAYKITAGAPTTCSGCEDAIKAGEPITFDPKSKRVYCRRCSSNVPVGIVKK